MIAIICAMSQERDAILKKMTNVVVKKGEKIHYHDELLKNECYVGKIGNKDVVLVRSGIGKVYATLSCLSVIKKFKPSLLINCGCAGSLNKDVHVGDVVIADRVADWEIDVPGWERSIHSKRFSFACDEKAVKLIKESKKIHKGPIVGADIFVYKKSQIKEIKQFFPTALCSEMECSAIGTTCYAYGVPFCVIRSISDETLIQNDYKNFDFNLTKACNNAANIVTKIIENY